jgi:hypothetical protein
MERLKEKVYSALEYLNNEWGIIIHNIFIWFGIAYFILLAFELASQPNYTYMILGVVVLVSTLFFTLRHMKKLNNRD